MEGENEQRVRADYLRHYSGVSSLGTGNLFELVTIPGETFRECVQRVGEANHEMSVEERMKLARAEAINEWLAANAVDFYNEVELLYGIVEEFHQRASDPMSYPELKEEFKDYKLRFPDFGNGFPKGFLYRLKRSKDSEPLNGAEYVNMSIIWMENQIDNPNIFPEDEEDDFPENFVEKHVREMFKRMFRIFAIIYAVCWPAVVAARAEAHVNTCFKHLYFFVLRFGLLTKKEDKHVFTKTKVKSIIDLEQLDMEYIKCEQTLNNFF